MAEAPSPEAAARARSAIALLRRARRELEEPSFRNADLEVNAAVLEHAIDALAELADAERCGREIRTVLLAWRDRLGSYSLTARALGDLDVHPDLALQLLRRGLDEVIDAAPTLSAQFADQAPAPTASR